MAKWIIQRPQEHTHPAEVLVAEQLRELDDKWTVIWGYYYTDKRTIDREGDFLVMNPAGGVLVSEVENTFPAGSEQRTLGRRAGQPGHPTDGRMVSRDENREGGGAAYLGDESPLYSR